MDIKSQQLLAELNDVITDFINSAKLNKRVVSRDDIVEMLTTRLKQIIDDNPEDKDKILLTSGMAMGIAMVLQIELKLSE